jgi:glutamine synthetase
MHLRELRELIKEHHVRFLRLQFTDIFGSFKNLAVPAAEIEHVLARRVFIEASVFTGVPELNGTAVYLEPDPATFMVFPWRPRDGAVARFICDGYSETGERFPGCVRGLLRETTQRVLTRQMALKVGAAIDFFLLRTDEKGEPSLLPQDNAGSCDLAPRDRAENFRRDAVNTLDEMGLSVASSQHAAAPGQNRLSLKAADVLTMADTLITFKFVLASVAQRHGLYASFIPKPFKNQPGAGMALTLALWDGEKNLFAPLQKGQEVLGPSAYGFAAGLTKHAPALTALACPTVNSYKRLIEMGWLSRAAFGLKRQQTILNPAPAQSALEYWLPDSFSNPYLLFTALIVAGMEGVNEAPAFSPSATMDRGISLPEHLGAAIAALREDESLRSALGDFIITHYIRIKEGEWYDFLREVHPWEIKRYLS